MEDNNFITIAVKENRPELITNHILFDDSKLLTEQGRCGLGNMNNILGDLESQECNGLTCVRCPFGNINYDRPSKDFHYASVESMRKWLKLEPLKKINESKIVYLNEDDLKELNRTNFSTVYSKHGFKYDVDFFDAINKTVFLKKDDKIYEIDTERVHDIYADYVCGDEITFETILNDLTPNPTKTYTEEDFINFSNQFSNNQLFDGDAGSFINLKEFYLDVFKEFKTWVENNKKE